MTGSTTTRSGAMNSFQPTATKVVQMIAVLVAVATPTTTGFSLRPSGPSSSSFVARQPGITSLTSGRSEGRLSMYFDDVSPRKYTVRWKQQQQEKQQSTPKTDDSSSSSNLHEEKLDLMRKRLVGHNAETAGELSQSEIVEQTDFWAHQAGVVGHAWGDELYDTLLGIGVGRSTPTVDGNGNNNTTLLACLAEFWRLVAHEVIDHNTDVEFGLQRRWLWDRKNKRRRSISDAPGSSSSSSSPLIKDIYLLVFPDCPELYDFKVFTRLVAAIQFGAQDHTVYLNHRFTLTLFHPKFKNSPTLLSPERHSPFPTLGLEFGPPTSVITPVPPVALQYRNKYNQPANNANAAGSGPPSIKRKQKGEPLLPPPDEADEELGHELVDGKIPEGTRDILEVLFNSAAASGKNDYLTHPDQDKVENGKEDDWIDVAAKTLSSSSTKSKGGRKSAKSDKKKKKKVEAVDASDDSIPEEGCDLALRFRLERQRRRRQIPTDRIQRMVQTWVDQNQYMDRIGWNRALQYWNESSAFVVCHEKQAEHVFAQLWKVIHDLYQEGSEMEARMIQSGSSSDSEKRSSKSSSSSKRRSHFDLGEWMCSLSGSPRSDANPPPPPPSYASASKVTSAVFVATKLYPYNAQAWKKFAIGINAPLRRFTDKRMYLEVFHPEYVGNRGYEHGQRRAPFAMLQICYQLRDKKSTE